MLLGGVARRTAALLERDRGLPGPEHPVHHALGKLGAEVGPDLRGSPPEGELRPVVVHALRRRVEPHQPELRVQHEQPDGRAGEQCLEEGAVDVRGEARHPCQQVDGQARARPVVAHGPQARPAGHRPPVTVPEEDASGPGARAGSGVGGAGGGDGGEQVQRGPAEHVVRRVAEEGFRLRAPCDDRAMGVDHHPRRRAPRRLLAPFAAFPRCPSAHDRPITFRSSGSQSCAGGRGHHSGPPQPCRKAVTSARDGTSAGVKRRVSPRKERTSSRLPGSAPGSAARRAWRSAAPNTLNVRVRR